jgi:uncharacterized ferritin-like protein (DUF455 family)
VGQGAIGASALAPGPARDPRFTVAERWVDCANFQEHDPMREIEFFHRQMNEEIDSLECSARNISDFPDTQWELRLGLARQCADEARHALMFRRIFEYRGGRVGQFPVLNFQYRIVTGINSLIGRLAVQNRSFEAGGLDAIAWGIEDATKRGDEELVQLFESQRVDEIAHVRMANEWIRSATAKDPRAVLQIGAALSAAAKGFAQLIGPQGVAGISYPPDRDGRREAGFTKDELTLASDLRSAMAG